MSSKTILIIGTSESSPDLYYRTRLFVPDPCIYVEHRGKRILVLSDLELDRGRALAQVDSVLSLSELRARISPEKQKNATTADIVDAIFSILRVKSATVPGDFSLKHADRLRAMGYDIIPSAREPLFPERMRKTPAEVALIKQVQRQTERAMRVAIEMISGSTVKRRRLYVGGKVLTSEMVKGAINSFLAGLGCTASHTIVASGMQGSLPHHVGTGPLIAHTPIVIDIFPRSQTTGYYGDMTRTVVKGEPSPEAAKMYKAVQKGQKLALRLIKAGVKGGVVHESVMDFFASKGFDTGVVDGKHQGFIHSTGHGLGLEIHEPPRITSDDTVLKEGMVLTVEPGLYYGSIGGVRIEDVIVVTEGGCENLNRFSKRFEV